MRSCVTTNQSIAGNSRPSYDFNNVKFSISKAGIGVFHDDINRGLEQKRSQNHKRNSLPDRRFHSRRYLHSRRSERRTPCRRPHGRRILDSRSRTESARDPRKKTGGALSVLRKSVELGLTAMAIPEEYGGMAMDLPSLMVTAERIGRDGSYGGWHSAHTGIGTLPIVYFGNEQQKQKYLPKLAKLEMLAAYALTEPLAGSDALAARTRADLSPDGKHYILSGQKMWITNGGAADLFTVFAKVGGEKFTAFLVERNFPGVSSGAEEHKMGITGSSTTAVYLDNVPVPVENVLGEIGRGHVIAFNILNIGRLKLGPASVGAAKNVLAICLKYAKQRKAFGTTISEFGAIQHKLAEMAIRIYAAESMTWRVAGLIENQMHLVSAEAANVSAN